MMILKWCRQLLDLVVFQDLYLDLFHDQPGIVLFYTRQIISQGLLGGISTLISLYHVDLLETVDQMLKDHIFNGFEAVRDEQCNHYGGICDNGVSEFRCSDYAVYTFRKTIDKTTPGME